MLGAVAMLDVNPGHALSTEIATRFGDELVTLLDATRRPEWSRWR